MSERMQKWKALLLASRPKTLPAVLVPVFIGSALAQRAGAFDAIAALCCLAFGLLIQIGTNYANDVYDHLKGADAQRRLGPARAVARGWLTPKQMKTAMAVTFVLALGCGLPLALEGPPWLWGIGIASVLCGIAYTGGPYPLGYNGLGDIFVILFFGFVATAVTYYVQAESFVLVEAGVWGQWTLWIAAVIPGGLANNLLVVNNYRDYESDRQVGKRTVVVRFGRGFGRWAYAAGWGLPALATAYLAVAFASLLCGLATLLCCALGIRLQRQLCSAVSAEQYGRLLAGSAALLVAVGGLCSVGLASRW